MSLCINPRCKQPNNSDTTIFCQGCGSELLLDGRYRVVRELGQGGFGITYEIIDFNSHSWVLKVLMDNHPKYIELFQQEAQVLSILNHPGIPKIDLDGYFLYFPTGTEESLHCLVMEKIEGLNLSDYIEQRGNRPIKPKRVQRWLAELALILEQVHNENFFHRDIKPSNIMLRANGCIALIDFGTVRKVTHSYLQKKATGEITGVFTHGYTSMEQMMGKAVLQSDFYALGGTAIYLLTVQNPGNFYDSAKGKLLWWDAVPELTPEFADLIDRMMAFSPIDRPPSSRTIFNEVVAINPSLKILDKYYNINTFASQSTVSASETSIRPIINSTKIAFDPFDERITPEFVERCYQELAEYIGPMANYICKHAVKQNPNMTETELCLALAKNISNLQQAKDFRQRFISRTNLFVGDA